MTSSAKHPQHATAIGMLILANLFWGLSFPVVKALVPLHAQAVPGDPGWFFTAYAVAPRFLLALVLLAAFWVRPGWEVTGSEVRQGVGIGLFAAMGSLLQNDALQYTSASTSAFLTQFYAILIPLFLAVRFRRNPGWIVWTSCLLVLAGVAVLGRFDWRELSMGRGEWETLLCSAFFMGQILLLDSKTYAGNRPDRITLVFFATATVVFWGMAFVTAPTPEALVLPWLNPGWVTLTLVLTLFCTVGAYTLMNHWQPKITATEAGLIYCFEPIFGSLMALVLPGLFSVWFAIHYPNEEATVALLVGGGLITAANLLLQFRPPAKT